MSVVAFRLMLLLFAMLEWATWFLTPLARSITPFFVLLVTYGLLIVALLGMLPRIQRLAVSILYAVAIYAFVRGAFAAYAFNAAVKHHANILDFWLNPAAPSLVAYGVAGVAIVELCIVARVLPRVRQWR